MSKKKNIIWKKKVDVLGTIYDVQFKRDDKRCTAYNCDGFTSWDEKIIRVIDTDCPQFDRKNVRHEVLHAFMFESALQNNTHVKPEECIHDEQMIDWIAIQWPKIYKVFSELDVLD